MTAHFVYLVENESRRVKIGHTQDPKHRMSNLGTSSAERLTLEHTWKLRGRDQAVAMEKALHRLFRYCRTLREWHQVDLHEVRSVGDMLVAGDLATAEAVCAALAEAFARWTEFERLREIRKGLSKRWETARYHELGDQLHEADRLWLAALKRARAAGLPPTDWEAAIEAQQAAPAAEREPRARTKRAPEAQAPRQRRLAEKSAPIVSGKAALAAYKAARGIA